MKGIKEEISNLTSAMKKFPNNCIFDGAMTLFLADNMNELETISNEIAIYTGRNVGWRFDPKNESNLYVLLINHRLHLDDLIPDYSDDYYLAPVDIVAKKFAELKKNEINYRED